MKTQQTDTPAQAQQSKPWVADYIRASWRPMEENWAMYEGLSNHTVFTLVAEPEVVKYVQDACNAYPHAQRLADELTRVLKHGSAGNENLIREALAQWEKDKQ